MSIEIIARETRKEKLTNRFGSNSLYFFNLKILRFLFLGRIEKETISFSKSYDVKENNYMD